MELRLAQRQEAEMCYQCIEDARAYHRSLGFVQWHPDYPTQQTILDDIARSIGYAFTDDAGIIGYCCIVMAVSSSTVKVTVSPSAAMGRSTLSRA